MRKLQFVLAIVLLLSTLGFGTVSISKAAAPPDPFEPAQYEVPETLGGYKVLAVLTDANYGCLGSDRRLILQMSDATPQEALQHFQHDRVRQELKAHNLDAYEKWDLEFVGPDKNRGDVVAQLSKTRQFLKEHGCKPFGSSVLVSAGDEICPSSGEGNPASPAKYPAFAIVQDGDAAIYPDAKAQAVFLMAPKNIGKLQTGYSAFLNNVLTDGNYFLQIGLYFGSDDIGRVVWSNTGLNCAVTPFDALEYHPGDPYWTTLTFTLWDTGWFQCAADANNWSSYECIWDSKSANRGTHLQSSGNTSIFVENWNPRPNWYVGFDNSLQAYGATIVRSADGISYPWTSQIPIVQNCRGKSIKPKGIIFGSLVNFGSLFFNLSTIPTAC